MLATELEINLQILSFYLFLLLGGKSSVLLDVKPWDDETDMKKLEEAVRSVQMPGLYWGACKSKNRFQYQSAYPSQHKI